MLKTSRQRQKPLRDRLYSRIIRPDDPDECWQWTGHTNGGYGKIRRGGNGPERKKILTITRAIWELEIGPIPDGLYVLHKCDNPPCCNPKHLFLGSMADNMADRNKKGRQARGEKTGLSKLTEQQAREIIAATTERNRDLARKYNISDSRICMIRSGKAWKHLITDSTVLNKAPQNRGEAAPLSKLADEQVLAIRAAPDKKLMEIAEEFNISKSNVWLIRHGKTWKHLL